MIQTITVPDEPTEVSLEDSLFDENDRKAEANSLLLGIHGVTAIDVMGAIGSGKTTLITRLAERLRSRLRMAVINGDPITADDILPIAELGVPVVQIAANACHLDADLVSQGLSKLDLATLDLVIIENVGNLICPGSFGLGSKGRIVVVSLTEGPWMVRKHPHMFLGARLVVINKQDHGAGHGRRLQGAHRGPAQAEARPGSIPDQLPHGPGPGRAGQRGGLLLNRARPCTSSPSPPPSPTRS